MPKLDSYQSCQCGINCNYLDQDENEPCWGFVQAVDKVVSEDNYDWVHVCEGHDALYHSGEYRREG